MDLYPTFRTLITLLKVLNDTTLTKSVQAFCDSGGLYQVPTANRAGDISVEISDQVLSVGRHLNSQVTEVRRSQVGVTVLPVHQHRVATVILSLPQYRGCCNSDLKTLRYDPLASLSAGLLMKTEKGASESQRESHRCSPAAD